MYSGIRQNRSLRVLYSRMVIRRRSIFEHTLYIYIYIEQRFEHRFCSSRINRDESKLSYVNVFEGDMYLTFERITKSDNKNQFQYIILPAMALSATQSKMKYSKINIL